MDPKHFKARKQKNLVTRDLGDEVVIYDAETDHCHVLNPAAAIAWKHCGGDATIDELAEAIASGTELPADPEVACLALEELKSAGLLEGAAAIPPVTGTVSRRQMLLGMGGIAALLPTVTSLLAPSPAMAASPEPTTTTAAPEPEPTTKAVPEPE